MKTEIVSSDEHEFQPVTLKMVFHTQEELRDFLILCSVGISPTSWDVVGISKIEYWDSITPLIDRDLLVRAADNLITGQQFQALANLVGLTSDEE